MTCLDLQKQIQRRGGIPTHIAIIMDGNGRWAKQKRLPRLAGHQEGINSVREITRICGEINIDYLTLYTFSSENWGRPKKEVSALMRLLLITIRKEVKELNKNNVRMTTIGNLDGLPKDARQGIQEGVELTRNNTGLNLVLALNYGSRQELVRAVHRIAHKIKKGTLETDAINEATITHELYTAQVPDPDLLIRTGGEKRISNFLLWQTAYTEFYLVDTYWPDFRELQLLEAVKEFQLRDRRYGTVQEQLTS